MDKPAPKKAWDTFEKGDTIDAKDNHNSWFADLCPLG